VILTSVPSLAAWWIVRSSDETCLVVDIEPSPGDKGITRAGKESYQTAEEAEADLKRLCGVPMQVSDVDQHWPEKLA
jgi:hypothetical protein